MLSLRLMGIIDNLALDASLYAPHYSINFQYHLGLSLPISSTISFFTSTIVRSNNYDIILSLLAPPHPENTPIAK